MENSTNAVQIISKLKEFFAYFGLPNEIVSDKGPPFNSFEFNAFYQSNGIKPIKSPSYHPNSNGSAERYVQTVKRNLEKSLSVVGGDRNVTKSQIKNKLLNLLFSIRNTPSSATAICPSECIFKFKPRTRADLLKPTYSGMPNNSQASPRN